MSVSLRDVSITFAGRAAGGVRAVEGLSLEIGNGEFCVLVGPSGCGKSTLLRAMAGLVGVSAGRIVGIDAGEVGLVFQDANLLPWRNVRSNVALPLELRGVGRAARRAAAELALCDVGLAEAAGRYPGQLSGGMKMRASVARALITAPRLLLMDEPFGALDEITRFRLDGLVRERWTASGGTVVFVTHSLSEALFLGTRVIVLSRRPARVVLDHRVDLPADRTGDTRISGAFVEQLRLLHSALTRAEGETS